jgi:hypothetical protein
MKTMKIWTKSHHFMKIPAYFPGQHPAISSNGKIPTSIQAKME